MDGGASPEYPSSERLDAVDDGSSLGVHCSPWMGTMDGGASPRNPSSPRMRSMDDVLNPKIPSSPRMHALDDVSSRKYPSSPWKRARRRAGHLTAPSVRSATTAAHVFRGAGYYKWLLQYRCRHSAIDP